MRNASLPYICTYLSNSNEMQKEAGLGSPSVQAYGSNYAREAYIGNLPPYKAGGWGIFPVLQAVWPFPPMFLELIQVHRCGPFNGLSAGQWGPDEPFTTR